MLLFTFAKPYDTDQNYRTPLQTARESEEPGAEYIIEMLLRSGAKEARLPSFAMDPIKRGAVGPVHPVNRVRLAYGPD